MSKLERHIGLTALVLYGVGDILGSGIYGLIGKVAGQMGAFVWLAFLAAFAVALMTGLSYAALGARHPKAAGSSLIVWKAFKIPLLAYIAGLATLCSGLTSMAAASRIFSGYFTGMLPVVPVWAAVLGFCMLLGGIVFAGIRQSLWVNAACTVIELTGLLIVIAAGIPYLGSVNIFALESIPQTGTLTPGLVLSGAVLAFYSFVGFEDVINVGEEVIDPKRTLPLGLLLAMLIASAVYMLIGVVAVSVVPPDQLAHSNQPLVDVVKKAWPWFPTQIFSVIALFAVANTALLNFIMSSRLLYGLANLGLLPKALAKVHAKTKTPYVAVIAVLAILLTLAYLGEVASLARATSLFVLLVFMAMNASLFLFQWRERHHKRSRRWRIPQIVPILGTLGAGTMLFFAEAKDYQIAGIMLAIIIGLYFIERPDPSQLEKFES